MSGGGKLKITIAALSAATLIAGGTTVAVAATGSARAHRAGGGGGVKVKLVEFKLIPSVAKAPAGTVTFVVHDAGKLAHQFVVLKTNLPAAKLKLKGSKAVETGRVGKIAAIKPGQTKRLTLHLKAGHYVLLCNLPGHYKAGQHADFVVLRGTGAATDAKTGGTAGGSSAKLPPLVAKGKTLFDKGPGGGVPYGCAHCHGMTAMGNIGPKIVGKNVIQIDQALGTVTMMAAFTNLTGNQIKAIAAYLHYLATSGK